MASRNRTKQAATGRTRSVADDRAPDVEPTDRPEGRLPNPAARPEVAADVHGEPVADDGRLDRSIRRRAYELFEQRTRDGGSGDAVGDWLQAEQELHRAARGRGDGPPSVEVLAGISDRPQLTARTHPELAAAGTGETPAPPTSGAPAKPSSKAAGRTRRRG